MDVDIDIKQRRTVRCPHCGEIVGVRDVCVENSGGRMWYPFLEAVGYYVDYDKRTEENDWYCKDMVLNKEQTDLLFRYCRSEEVYNSDAIATMVAVAEVEGDDVVINANW